MSWRELWAVQRLGSKVSACVSPAGDEISVGVTNTIALTGVSNRVSLEDARALAFALFEITGGVPVPTPPSCTAGAPENPSFGGNHGRKQ